MGSQVSTVKSTSSVVANSLINVAQNFSKSCGETSTAINSMKIDLSGAKNANLNGISQSNMVHVNFSCINSSDSSTGFSSALQEQVQKDLTSATSGLGGLSSVSDINSKINTVVNATANLKVNDLQTCFSNNTSSNEMQIVAVGAKQVSITNITQDNAMEIAEKCVNSSSALAQAMSSLDSAVSEKSTSSVSGVDPTMLLYAGLACVALCLICSIVSSVVSMFRAGGSGAAQQQQGVPFDVSQQQAYYPPPETGIPSVPDAGPELQTQQPVTDYY